MNELLDRALYGMDQAYAELRMKCADEGQKNLIGKDVGDATQALKNAVEHVFSVKAVIDTNNRINDDRPRQAD